MYVDILCILVPVTVIDCVSFEIFCHFLEMCIGLIGAGLDKKLRNVAWMVTTDT